jgi:AH receptor-interacting protein
MSNDAAQKEQMVLGSEAFNCGIQKSLIHAGKSPIEYVDGTKVYFHYKSVVQEDGSILDDSKLLNEKKPMEIIIGKKFKLEIWERALKTMWLNEVAKFSVVKELLYDYPVVAKQLREYYESLDDCSSHSHSHHGHSHQNPKKSTTTNNNNHRSHCCGYNLIEHGVGYSDLDSLLKQPKDLDFILELVRVEQPGEYLKDAWSLSDQERIAKVPQLKEEGNRLFGQQLFEQAAAKYEQSLGFLEQLMLKEKPNEPEWRQFNDAKLLVLFNFSLCKFHLGDFYGCLEHTTSIVEQKPDHVKALYRRAKAHVAVWSFEEARRDFEACLRLDDTLSKDIGAQLNYINQLALKHDRQERQKFKGKLF